MANEFFRASGPDVAISLVPRASGRLEVYADGDKIYDRREEGDKFPDLSRVKEMKVRIKAKLDAVPSHAGN